MADPGSSSPSSYKVLFTDCPKFLFFFFFSVVPDFAKLWLGRFWASELCTVSALHGSPPSAWPEGFSLKVTPGGSSVPGNAPLPDP